MLGFGELLNVARMWVGALFLAARPSDHLTEKPFMAVWNSPTITCETKFGVDIPISEYGITENKGGGFRGDKIVIFYETQLGYYPELTPDEIPINGGIPQLADVERHLAKATDDIERAIPDKDFSGLAVIDWEEWRPIYDRNHGQKRMYQRWSRALVEDQHPDWDWEKVDNEARIQFEEAARILMEGTLELAKDLRPKAKWGFYGFPRCYNQQGEAECSNQTKAYNDKLSWLFEASSGIYPAGYIRPFTVNPRHMVYGQNTEALRVRHLYSKPTVPVIFYTRLAQSDGDFYTKEDLENSLRLSADQGVDGVVVWGSSNCTNTKNKCENLQEYMINTFGPYIKQVLDNAQWCSTSMCNSNGRCRKKNPLQEKITPFLSGDVEEILNSPLSNRIHDVPYRVWRKNVRIYRRLRHFFQEGYECQCFEGWEGLQCDISVIY